MSHETTTHTEAQDNGKKMRRVIWRTFWILLAITIFELFVGFKFTEPQHKEAVKLLFIGLTIIKAYYIVGYFMHLKHERLPFTWTILLPFVLIIYLIYMMLYEAYYLHHVHTVIDSLL